MYENVEKCKENMERNAKKSRKCRTGEVEMFDAILVLNLGIRTSCENLQHGTQLFVVQCVEWWKDACEEQPVAA